MKTKDSAVSLVGPDVRSVPDSPSVRGWFSVPAEMASSAGADVRCFLCLKPKGWDAVVVIKERVGELVFYALGEYAWIDASTWRFLLGRSDFGSWIGRFGKEWFTHSMTLQQSTLAAEISFSFVLFHLFIYKWVSFDCQLGFVRRSHPVNWHRCRRPTRSVKNCLGKPMGFPQNLLAYPIDPIRSH